MQQDRHRLEILNNLIVIHRYKAVYGYKLRYFRGPTSVYVPATVRIDSYSVSKFSSRD